MKVKFTDEAKSFITVAELPKVREIIRDLKEDDGLEDYINIIARAATGGIGFDRFEIFKAEAEIAKNKEGVGYFTDNDLDVWVNAYAFNSYCGFYILGFYLSDAWQYNGDNTEEILSRCYIRRFKEEK